MELVIVIAVVAVLATVLMPTFGSMTRKAQNSQVLQAAKNTFAEYFVEHASQGGCAACYVYADSDRYVALKNGTPIGVYASQQEALKVLYDNPGTDEDESTDYSIFRTGVEKLYVCEEARQLASSVLGVYNTERWYKASEGANPVCFRLLEGDGNDLNDVLEGKTVKRIGVPVLKLDDANKDCQINVHVVTKSLPAVILRSYPLLIPAVTYAQNEVNEWVCFDVDIPLGKGEMLAFGTSAALDGFTFAFVKEVDGNAAVNASLAETFGCHNRINTGNPVTYDDFGLLFDIYYGETDTNENPLAGKYISFLGASTSTFYGYSNNKLYNSTLQSTAYYQNGKILNDVNEQWWMKTINDLDLNLCVNNAWGGTTVTTKGTGPACMDWATQLHNDNRNIEPDIIVLCIGGNDALSGWEIGEYNGISDIYDGGSYIGNTKLFGQAYATMVHKVKARYPNAEIYVCSMLNWSLENMTATNLEPYNDVIRQIAADFGIIFMWISTMVRIFLL